MREYIRREAYPNRDVDENKQSLRDMLKGLGREWKASYSNRLKELETPPEFLQKAFQIAQSFSYKDHQRSADEILRLGSIEKTYVFRHHAIEKTYSGYRFLYENSDLKMEIFNQKDDSVLPLLGGTRLVLSLYSKLRENDGKYFVVSILPDHEISPENILLRWAEGMPERLIADFTLSQEIVNINIGKMTFDTDNEKYLDYFSHLFDEVKIDLYKVENYSDDM